LSNSRALEMDLFEFQLAVLKSIPRALEETHFPPGLIPEALLASRVFKLVEDRWRQICKNPNVSKHLNKKIMLGRTSVTWTGSELTLGYMLVEDILNRQISGLQRLTVRHDENISKDLADFFLKDEVTVVTKAPIYGLLIISSVPLLAEEGIQLIPQMPHLAEFAFPTSNGIGPSEIYPDIVFEHRWSEKKIVEEAGKGSVASRPLEEDLSFRRLVLILRLLGMSNFSAPLIENRLLAPGLPFGYKKFYYPPPWSHRHRDNIDEIGEREASGLLEAWKALKQLIPVGDSEEPIWLKIALARMDMACERYDARESLLDLCISIEALLGREQSEVSYKFCQRGSLLLLLASRSLRPGSIESARELLDGVYGLRSGLVHARSNDLQRCEQTNRQLFELVRIFCLKAIALAPYFSHDNIIDRIDLSMVSPDELKELEYELEASPLAQFWNPPYEKVSVLFSSKATSPTR